MIKLGNKVVVSDPCYELGTWCMGVIDNVLPGNYSIDIQLNEEGRCSNLFVLHECFNPMTVNWERNEEITIGVDSGQAGIFSFESYRNNEHAEKNIPTPGQFDDWDNNSEGELWYNKMCYMTCQDDIPGGSYDEGVVAQSGYGDGSYDLYIAENEDNQIVAIEIVFLEDYLEEDEDVYEHTVGYEDEEE